MPFKTSTGKEIDRLLLPMAYSYIYTSFVFLQEKLLIDYWLRIIVASTHTHVVFYPNARAV